MAVVGLSACEVDVVAVVVAFCSFLSSLLPIMVQWWDGRMAGWHTGTGVVGGEKTGVGWREMLWYAMFGSGERNDVKGCCCYMFIDTIIDTIKNTHENLQ